MIFIHISAESPSDQEFNDYMAENGVCQASSRYSIDVWNVHDNIRQKLPRKNNAAEAYNYGISTIFPAHPHIYEFIGRLKDEHEFQHHNQKKLGSR